MIYFLNCPSIALLSVKAVTLLFMLINLLSSSKVKAKLVCDQSHNMIVKDDRVWFLILIFIDGLLKSLWMDFKVVHG
jgi:hypothetical protein